MGDIEAICSPSGSIVVDTRFEPIVIATWFDAPEQSAIRRFFAWNNDVIERARVAGGYVLITDSDCASRPAAIERKLISTLTDQLPEDTKTLKLGDYIVLNNPVVRAAIMAMRWVGANPWAITTVKTCAQAIEGGLQDLRNARMRPPAGLDPATYRPPRRPD